MCFITRPLAGLLVGFAAVLSGRFLMSRSLAPALVTAADIVEHDLDGNSVDAKGRSLFLEGEEGAKADKINEQVVGRPWGLWKRKALGK